MWHGPDELDFAPIECLGKPPADHVPPLIRKTKRKSAARTLDARAKMIMAKNPAWKVSDHSIDVRALKL